MNASKYLALLAVMVLISCSSVKRVHQTEPTRNLIIYYDGESGNGELLKAAKKYGADVLYVYKNINGIAVRVPAGKSVPDAMKYFGKFKGVLSVNEDRILQLD